MEGPAAAGSEDDSEAAAAANLRLCEAEAGLLSARNMWAWMATPANAPGDVGGLFPGSGAFCISNPVRHCARALRSCVANTPLNVILTHGTHVHAAAAGLPADVLQRGLLRELAVASQDVDWRCLFSSAEGPRCCLFGSLLPTGLTFVTLQEQTGFKLEEVVGRNCRFLQCAETSKAVVSAMRNCVSHFRRHKRGDGDVGAQTFRVINAKKDGTRFLNLVHIAPIYDALGVLCRMVGVQYGLSLVGRDFSKLFQGLITKADFDDLGEKTHADMLREWGSFLPRAEQKPGSREQVILHMEQQMTAAISDLLRTMDWAKVTAVCNAVDPIAGKRLQPVKSTAGEKKRFAGAAGGPTGAPGQALQKRARS